jgi:hypothetical protein
MKTIRIAELRRQLTNHSGTTWTPPGHRLRHEFFARRDLAPAYRRTAASAQIIENLFVGQD